jgi:hypothetical protein
MASQQEAEDNQKIVTHEGACGLCSSLQDLSVFMETPDLTSVGIGCAIEAVTNFSNGVNCFMQAGFSEGCATIWTYDALKTHEVCFESCTAHAFSGLPNFGLPPRCTPVECLVCDENKNGPAFKKYAGRTRRSSGLLSGLVRQCSEIASVIHVDPCAVPASNACEDAKDLEEKRGEPFGTVCECGESEGQVKLTCVDTTCLGCSDDLGVCAEFSFGDYFLENGELSSSFTEVQYIQGRKDLLFYSEDASGCAVHVNGVPCDQCIVVACDDGFEGIEIQCSNVMVGEDFSVCDRNFSTDSVFQFFNAGEFDSCAATRGDISCQKEGELEDVPECECSRSEDDDQTKLTCVDTTCQYCNDEGTVCSEFSYGGLYSVLGELTSSFEAHEYIKGRSEQVLYSYDLNNQCTMSVEGVDCTSCEIVTCTEGENAGEELPIVTCPDVANGTNFNRCDTVSTDGVFQVYNMDEFNECKEVPTCAPLFASCAVSSECCSDRCFKGKCRTATKGEGKSTFKLSGGRGGIGGVPKGRLRGL